MEKLERLKIQHNSPEWLEMRRTGIGGSDAAAVLGISPFKSNVELWEEKVGLRAPADLSDDPLVNYGKEAEEHLVKLFALDHPEMEVWTDKTVVYRRGCMFASLDAEAKEDTLRGEIEVKSALARSAAAFKKWQDQIPDYYYAQIIHQLNVTGFDFAVCDAQIKRYFANGTMEKVTREYRFDRRNVAGDMEYLAAKVKEFWGYVERRERPPLVLPRI